MLEQIEFDKTPSNTSVNGWTTLFCFVQPVILILAVLRSVITTSSHSHAVTILQRLLVVATTLIFLMANVQLCNFMWNCNTMLEH